MFREKRVSNTQKHQLFSNTDRLNLLFFFTPPAAASPHLCCRLLLFCFAKIISQLCVHTKGLQLIIDQKGENCCGEAT